jgi:hypothetical protein
LTALFSEVFQDRQGVFQIRRLAAVI